MSMKNANIVKLLYAELPKRGVKVSTRGVKEALLSHPHYPSLQSISDYLGTLGIATMSVRINLDQLREASTEAEAIIFLEEKGQSYPVLVKSIGEKSISYTSNGKKTESDTLEALEEKWKGITLLFQTEGAIGETDYKENMQQKKRAGFYLSVAIIGILCFLGLACYYSHNTLDFTIMLLPKLLGLFFAVLLAATELGFKLPVAERLCSISTNHGCEKVMQSKASSITKDIKLADVGVGYFVSVLLCMMVFSFSGSTLYASGLQTLSLLSLLCLPFVIFSISYQLFVVKAQCPLCLGVMGMLIVDVVVYWLMGYIGFSVVTIPAIALVVGVLMLVAGSWMLVKRLIQDRQLLQNEHHKLHQLRQHPDRISQALIGVEVEDMGDGESDIILGSHNPKVTFTEVINPYCGPCGKALNELIPLLDIFPDDLQIRIRFTGLEDDMDSDRATLTHHLISYAATHNQDEVKKALTEWFDNMKLEEWKKRFPVKDSEYGKAMMPAQIKWSRQVKIAYTPTSFCNGKRIPTSLAFNDLRYWLSEIME